MDPQILPLNFSLQLYFKLSPKQSLKLPLKVFLNYFLRPLSKALLGSSELIIIQYRQTPTCFVWPPGFWHHIPHQFLSSYCLVSFGIALMNLRDTRWIILDFYFGLPELSLRREYSTFHQLGSIWKGQHLIWFESLNKPCFPFDVLLNICVIPDKIISKWSFRNGYTKQMEMFIIEFAKNDKKPFLTCSSIHQESAFSWMVVRNHCHRCQHNPRSLHSHHSNQ